MPPETGVKRLLQSIRSVLKILPDVYIYIEQKGKNHHVVFLVDEIGQYMIYLKNLEEQIHLGNKEFSNRYVIFSKVESLHLICENINIGFEKFNVNKYSVKLFKERY